MEFTHLSLFSGIGGRYRVDGDTPPRLLHFTGRNEKQMGICALKEKKNEKWS